MRLNVHLFTCTANPTTFTPLDLWQNPRKCSVSLKLQQEGLDEETNLFRKCCPGRRWCTWIRLRRAATRSLRCLGTWKYDALKICIMIANQ